MTPERAAELFKTLSNPHRVRIVRQLWDKALQCHDPQSCDLSEWCCDVGGLAMNLEISPPTVSYHLKELRATGLIAMQRRGRHLYCVLNTDELKEALTTVFPEVTV